MLSNSFAFGGNNVSVLSGGGVIALHVGGVGLWTPGFASAAAWASGTPDPAVTSPRSEILPAALRRRASPLTSMVASAAGEAAAQAGADLARLPFVLGSALGEIGIAVTMLNEYRVGEGLPSPTRFHNAVHNGPAATCPSRPPTGGSPPPSRQGRRRPPPRCSRRRHCSPSAAGK